MAQRLTTEQVVDILGRMDDLRVVEIVDTGATAPELVEAKRWVEGYKRTLGDDEPLRPSIVTQLCDILRADEPEWFERG